MSYTEGLNKKKADINVFYKTDGDLKLPLQVFLPDKFNESNKYKAVVAIHGGGWHSFKETPTDWDGGWMANNVKYFAEKGYVGIVFSYRDIDFNESCNMADLLNDCRDALRYIKDKFSFIDTDDILLMGDSAGGHLALCLGMCLPDDTKSPVGLKRIALYNPVTDFVSSKWSCRSDDPEKYSPVHNIKQIDLKLLMMHGTADTLVSIDNSRFFTEKMKAEGNDISMIEVPDARHAFILFGYNSEDKDVIEVLEITDKFFNS